MKQAIYLYQAVPSRGEMLLANDSSSFTLPFFQEAQEILAKVRSFPLSSDVSFYPNGAKEDAVMALARTSFKLSEWLLPALVVDADDNLFSALLMNRAHPEQVLALSFKSLEANVCCLNGVEICEEGGEKMSGKEFLSTLSLSQSGASFAPKKQSMPVDLGYLPDDDDNFADDDEAPINIEVSRPSFVPSSKKGTRDLGSSYSVADIADDEEDPVSVNVQKETFSAGSKKKPKDLGSFSKDRKRAFANAPRQDDEPDQKVIASSFLRPQFEPNSKPKAFPQNDSRRRLEQKKPEAIERQSNANAMKTPSFTKPAFEPNVKAKPAFPTPNTPSFTPNQRQYGPRLMSEPAGSMANEIPSKEEEEIFLFSPDKKGVSSRTIINDPSLMFVARKFVREGNLRFASSPKAIDSSATQYVGVKEEEKAGLLKKALSADISSWDLLAMNVESNGMPHTYLLSSKDDPSLCAVYSVEGESLSLLCLTHNGVSVEDPSLDYASLRLLCFPNKEA